MTVDLIKQAESLLTRTAIMQAQHADLLRKFADLEAAQLRLIQDLRDAANEQRRTAAA